MPYIMQHRREFYQQWISNIPCPKTSGELNYIITKLCNNYLKCHGKKYVIMNDVIGALDGASKEFYRRVIAPYEDKKIEVNGDVYDG